MGWETADTIIMTRFQTNVVALVDGISPSVSSTTVSADATDDSFNDATETLSVFKTGQQIVVAGFTESANNGIFTVDSATANKITTTGSLTTEAAGDSVTIKTALAVQYDNDGSFDKPDGVKWVRCTTNGTDAFKADTSTYRNPGLMIAQIFVPMGEGSKSANELADIVIAAFRGFGSSGVKFRTPNKAVVGEDAGTGEWQVNVNCPFYFDD